MKRQLLPSWKVLCFLGTAFWATSCTKMLNETAEGGTRVPVTNAPLALDEPELVELFREDFDQNNINKQNDNFWRTRKGRSYAWGKTIAMNADENVSVDESILSLKYTMQKGTNDTLFYIGGGIISNASFGYGRYEAKVKLYTGSYGYHQSFWMSNDIQDLNGFEFDSRLTGFSYLYPSCYNHLKNPDEKFEFIPSTGDGYKALSGGATKLDPGFINTYNQPTNTSNTPWHTFVYDWKPGSITMYLDNEYFGKINPTGTNGTNFDALYSPSPVYLSGIPFKFYPQTNLVPPSEGARMQVGYFSYSARKHLNVNILGDPAFKNAIFNSAENGYLSSMWRKSRITGYDVSDKGYTNNVIQVNGQNYLQHKGTGSYQANSYQTLQYIRNGTYKLSADIMCSDHSADGLQLIAIDITNQKVLASYSVQYAHSTLVTITAKGKDANGNPTDTFSVTNNNVRVLIRSNVISGGGSVQVASVKLVAVN